MKNRKTGKRGTITVDFTGIETGGGRLLPEGDYLFEIEEVTLETSENSGADYLKFTLVVSDGKFKGAKAWDNFSLQPQALWRLKSLMETLEMEVPDGVTELDPKEFEGLIVGATVFHEEYQGKTKHKIGEYFPASESTDEEKPSPKNFKVGQRVSFRDGKRTLQGKITDIDDSTDPPTLTVRSGSEDYELTPEEVTTV